MSENEEKMCCGIDCKLTAKWSSSVTVRTTKRVHVTYWCDIHASELYERNPYTVKWERLQEPELNYSI